MHACTLMHVHMQVFKYIAQPAVKCNPNAICMYACLYVCAMHIRTYACMYLCCKHVFLNALNSGMNFTQTDRRTDRQTQTDTDRQADRQTDCI